MRFFDTLSGKGVETKVDEYSEVYGEVLLGVHRDLEKQKRLLHDSEQRLDSQAELLRDYDRRLTVQGQSIQKYANDLDAQTRLVSSCRKDLEAQAGQLDACRRSLDEQRKVLADQQRELPALRQALTAQSQQVATLADGSRDLQERVAQVETQVKAALGSLDTTIKQFQSESTALVAAKDDLSRLTDDVRQKTATLEERLASQDQTTATLATQAKHIQQLRIFSILSYVFAFALGVVLWLIR
jgi:chromosome segregation ATPase